MAVNCSPFGPKPQFELASGAPAVGYQLFFYAAGSVSTKQNTYTDSTGLTANPNPVVLNSLGQPTNQLWLTAGQAYKVVYAPAGDTDPPSSPIWTIDNLFGINDVTTTITDWIAGPTPTYTGVSTFTLVGDQTTNFHIGRRIKTINSGGTKYGTITNSVFTSLTTVTVSLDAGTLDSGLSAVFYGLISAVNPSLPNSAAVHNTMGISAALQKQTYAAFTTSGISTAFTLTPSPAITANTANTEFEVTFNAAAGATPTLAVSGLTALPLKYRDQTGALQAVTSTQVPSGLVSKVYTDGTNWIVLNPATVPAASNLKGGGAGQIPYQSAADTTALLAAGTTGQVLASGGAGAPSWIAGPIGVGQTWQAVARTSGTPYTNNTGKPILVSAIATLSTAPGLTVVVDGITIASSSTSNVTVPYSFIVPNGSTYTMTCPAGLSVAELR